MKLLKPKALKIGDTIGIIAPSSPPRDSKVIDPAIKALKQLGFKVKPGRSIKKRNGYLAGSDDERAKDLNRMFADKTVDAILCLRGGYGAARILDKIDFNTIKKNPKIFCGYSDITGLQLAIYKKTGLVTFHGPMLLRLCSAKDRSDHTLVSWLRAVMSKTPYGDVSHGMPKKKSKSIVRGSARGELLGGNLSIIASLVGTEYLPSFSGKILFIEDVNEAPYRVDRLLTQLLLSGALKGVKGVAIGDFSGEGNYSAVFRDRLLALKIPVVSGLPFGHINDHVTLPQGGIARIDAGSQRLVIVESSVR